jgi:hypothetical protein
MMLKTLLFVLFVSLVHQVGAQFEPEGWTYDRRPPPE